MTVKIGESAACRGQARLEIFHEKADMPEVSPFFANEALCLDFLTLPVLLSINFHTFQAVIYTQESMPGVGSSKTGVNTPRFCLLSHHQ